jgi:predicted phage-related endonuclease
MTKQKPCGCVNPEGAKAMSTTTQNLGDRTTYIGASDVPIIMGSLYDPEHKKTRWHLWASKVGHPDYVPPPPPGREALVGLMAEQFLRAYAEGEIGYPVDLRGRTRRLEGTPILVHLDAVVREPPTNSVPLECKTAGLFGAQVKGWSRETIPLYVYHQVQAQIAAADAPKAYVVALIRGFGLLEPFVVERDDECINEIIAKCKEFWWHVENKVEPDEARPYDEDIAVRTLRAGSVELPPEMLPLLRDYDEVSRQMRDAEKKKEHLRQVIIAALGSAESGFVSGWSVQVKKVVSQRVNASKLKESHPDIYAECLSTSEYLRLTVKPPKGDESNQEEEV